MDKSTRRTEFGDFQTPPDVARAVCRLLAERGVSPASIVEPTCGVGNFLLAALEQFPDAAQAVGMDINPRYVEETRRRLKESLPSATAQVLQGDFFSAAWERILGRLPSPILLIGNPPWVTNAALSGMGSANLPRKSNFLGLSGLDAKTGRSNFDISEWMLLHLLGLLSRPRRRGTLAMLCKTSVARRVLTYSWQHYPQVTTAALYLVDAEKVFGAAVDACLLVADVLPGKAQETTCRVYADLSGDALQTTFGYRDGLLIADIARYERWRHLSAGRQPYRWRSGIKHDCAPVMELEKWDGGYRNKLGEVWDLEDDYLYPLLKGSDIAAEGVPRPTRWMLVPQKHIGAETATIRHTAPKTWAYLTAHEEFFTRRRSLVYRGRPRFSVFGVGDYTFAPWKVAISGLHKSLNFVVVGPHAGKPVVFDDTCYFLPCRDEDEARHLAALLGSTAAQEFLRALIFWDAKRPITIGVLKRLNLVALAAELAGEGEAEPFGPLSTHQLALFRHPSRQEEALPL